MKKFPAVYRHVSFRGGLHMVSEQLHYITNREEIFDFSNKKCCIYAACGVSQTPILYIRCERNPTSAGGEAVAGFLNFVNTRSWCSVRLGNFILVLD